MIALTVMTVSLGIAVSWFIVSYDMRREIDELTITDLARDAYVFMNVLDLRTERTEDGRLISFDELTHWSGLLGVRISIIDMAGNVLADSSVPYEELPGLGSHADRIEVKDAVQKGFGQDRRYSETTRIPYLYYAVKAHEKHSGSSIYIIRCSLPLSRFYTLLSRVRWNILAALLISGSAALAVGVYGVRNVTRPIRRLIEALRAARRGEAVVYPLDGPMEIGALSVALKESAEAQSRIMDELQAERNLLETVVQSAPCGLMLVGAGGVVEYANAVLSPLLREDPGRCVGMGVKGVVRAPDLAEAIGRARQGDSGELRLTFRYHGTERFYNCRIFSLGEGGVLVVVDDITERHLMEEARKSFVADAGHELQTPLSAISVSAELLREMPDSTQAERLPYIEEIMRQRERMTLLVDDLLLLSKLESGVPMSPPEPFDLAADVALLVSEARERRNAAHIQWRLDLPVSLMYTGRRSDLRRAVSNLLDNAVKYTRRRYADDSGGEIAVSLKESGPDVILTVSDNGVGVPPGDIARIFGRFERVERDRSRGADKTGGYGLGLAIVKKVVQSHCGSVAVESGSQLTTFTVTLPV